MYTFNFAQVKKEIIMHTVKLIDSTYPESRAREVILSLLNDKIRFINLQILSLEEKENLDTLHLRSRLEELKAERDQICDLLRSEGSAPIQVNCSIEFEVLNSLIRSRYTKL